MPTLAEHNGIFTGIGTVVDPVRVLLYPAHGFLSAK